MVLKDFRGPGAGSGNRTRILSLEGCCTTIVLYPRGGRPRSSIRHRGGGGSRTRTYEGIASGFTVRPLCRSGHSPVRDGGSLTNLPTSAPTGIDGTEAGGP